MIIKGATVRNNPPIQIRPAVETDLGLVVSTWVGSHRSAVKWLTKADHDRLFRPAVKQAIEIATVLVACEAEHPTHVYGWVCAEIPAAILHYAFVKSKFRRIRIGTRLIMSAMEHGHHYRELTATAWTQDSQHLIDAGLTSNYRPDLFPPGG